MTPAECEPRIRVFSAGICTETNVFSPIPTGLGDFEVLTASDPQDAWMNVVLGSSFVRYADRATACNCEYIQGMYARATPAGLATKETYEVLRDRLLADLTAASPVDAIVLTLHGSMAAEGYVDCETDLVSRVRALVGDEPVLGLLLDPHCDLPDALVDSCDVIIAFKEYPHTDRDDRAIELVDIVIDAARGRVRPVMATYDCRMIGLYPTTREPMRTFVREMHDAEELSQVLSVSLGHGFPWGDSPATGARTLVVADADRATAMKIAEDLGQRFFALRHEVGLQTFGMTEALDKALSSVRVGAPIVLADTSDNVGGGAPGDATFVLRELLARGVDDAALALFFDPAVVSQAFAVGEGSDIVVRLGGKHGVLSGEPVEMRATVRALVPELTQRWPQTDGFADVPSGAAARLSVNGIDVIVGARRQQVLGLEVFSAFGINPRQRRLLVVKSTHHFHAAFAPVAAEIIYVSAPGALCADPRELPYTRADTKKFPWVDDPWAA